MHQQELKVFVYGTLKSGYQITACAANGTRDFAKQSESEGRHSVGGRNHVRYCQGVIRVEEATIIGRLYDMGVGFPALELPTEAILAHGTSDHKADLQTLQKHTVDHESWRPLPEFGPNWGIVHGQVLTFPYPGHQLDSMDRLEGLWPPAECHPFGTRLKARAPFATQAVVQPGGRSLYQRVLATARWNGQTGPVWVYVMMDLRGKRRILEGVWEFEN